MKGGVLFDPRAGGFVVIVHTWDNIACRGEPEEWRYPELFPTEETAMRYYKTNIRPALKQMMAETAKDPGLSFAHRQLEEWPKKVEPLDRPETRLVVDSAQVSA
jgi:hypothetical protein